jgi:hypothetical protein
MKNKNIELENAARIQQVKELVERIAAKNDLGEVLDRGYDMKVAGVAVRATQPGTAGYYSRHISAVKVSYACDSYPSTKTRTYQFKSDGTINEAGIEKAIVEGVALQTKVNQAVQAWRSAVLAANAKQDQRAKNEEVLRDLTHRIYHTPSKDARAAVRATSQGATITIDTTQGATITIDTTPETARKILELLSTLG